VKARYNRSSSGQFDACIFTNWFEHLFLLAVRNILTTDIDQDRSSHFNEQVLQLAAEHNTRFACIPKKFNPSNTTIGHRFLQTMLGERRWTPANKAAKEKARR